MPTSSEIRRQFLDFFIEKHGHTFVPSSPVVPHDDPTLLFTNAGMNQFKPIFLGLERRPYARAANSQKCIRAGGKHNDLDDVGRSRRHHTFFEMLGNWSFGDYFKREAITWAWELLTKVWSLDPTRLHVSCFEGAEGVPRDDEAADLWREIAGLGDSHIHFFGKDNFWEMADTGPCGPCSEIHFDSTPDLSGGPLVNGTDPRVMEIWNLVFIQYNRDASGKLSALPAKHVDTGMGLERISQVIQNVDSTYGIDSFEPYWKALSDLSGHEYAGTFPSTNAPDPTAEAASPQLRTDIAFRVIADHVRCLTFALTDGATPSNEGRGYVLRRILRRAVRFGRQQLDLREPFMHKLVPVVAETMGDAFPELRKNPRRIAELIEDEEVSFGRTLDRGIQLFEASARGDSISATDAFKLHDTYGFPIDLTQIMAAERGMSVDIAGYEKLMERAKEIARSGGKPEASQLARLPADAMARLVEQGVKPTDDTAKFVHKPIDARVMAIWNGDDLGLSPARVLEDEELAIILDRTNFYAEMGGQVGDRGALVSGPNQFDVESTHSVGGFILHVGRLRAGNIRVGDSVIATVSVQRRATMQNHTGTHLANWALREVLGDAVEQKGSLVDPDKLRFDFSHGKPLTDQEIGRIEGLVSASVEKKLPVHAEVVPQEQALKINGLRAVFGEKYPPKVRVVSIGVPVADSLKDPTSAKWREFSIEFCGGTHLTNTFDVGPFVITSEESVSKGVRRIVALTGDAAAHARSGGEKVMALALAERLIIDEGTPERLNGLQKELGKPTLPILVKRKIQELLNFVQSQHKTWEKSQRASAAQIDVAAVAADLLDGADNLAGTKVVVASVSGASEEQLRSIIDSIRKRTASFAALLACSDGQKLSFVAVVSDDLIAKGLKAGNWVRE
ncbi:MAG: alanine--tRNA ligase, partial [Tepidisphaeraceae bacterium]